MWRRLLGGCMAFVVLVATTVFFAEQSFAQSDSEYRIAPGDRVSISVYGEPDLSFSDLPIPSNGTITYPFIGQVVAENLTELELSKRIASGLSNGYLLQPQVTVAITGYRPIYVGGAVREPGQKSFFVGMNVERLLALAGGMNSDADLEAISIQRSLSEGSDSIKATLSTSVLPGDVITVGQRVIEEKQVAWFYLEGEVRAPGRYEYSRDLSVQKAIAIAGGFGLRASKRKISIVRGNSDERLKKVPLETPVYPGDVITVGTSLF